ncbi:MAG: nucleotidyltransferase domain-containing protein [Sandaracinaceae bacterium]|nr:nucleotidyltransferase domain-containing protein [Sandaracinaceae bacterium]
MSAALREIAEATRRAIAPRALLLVGSYARAEGGVVIRDGAPRPYNDLDLVAVVDRVERGTHEALKAIAHHFEPRAGVSVDLWPIEIHRLSPPPRTLFWLDVSLGGVKLVDGDATVLSRVALRPRDVPLEEAGRLLANRAVGLALSQLDDEGARSEMDSAVRDDDRTRHLHKAVLACGDALLLAAGAYVGSVEGRREALAKLAGAPHVTEELVGAYAAACRFRARPATPKDRGWEGATLRTIARAHLAFEALRVGAPEDPEAYARTKLALFPVLPDVRPLGRLGSALRARAAGVPLLPWVGHPRERLARVAVALAYGGARTRPVAEQLLGTRGADARIIRDRLLVLSHRGG